MKKKSKQQRAAERLGRRLDKIDANNPLTIKDLIAINDYTVRYLAYRCQRCWDGAITFWKAISRKMGPQVPILSEQLPCPKCGKIYK